MNVQPSNLPFSTSGSIDPSKVSIDCFTRVFSDPNLDLTYAAQHLIFDDLAAGKLDEREVARLEVLASQNDDINLLVEAFSPFEDDFRDCITEMLLDDGLG